MVVTLEFLEGLLLVGTHDVRNIVRRVQVADSCVGSLRQQEISNRVDDVGLAQPDAAIYEQRVVGRTRMFCNL